MMYEHRVLARIILILNYYIDQEKYSITMQELMDELPMKIQMVNLGQYMKKLGFRKPRPKVINDKLVRTYKFTKARILNLTIQEGGFKNGELQELREQKYNRDD